MSPDSFAFSCILARSISTGNRTLGCKKLLFPETFAVTSPPTGDELIFHDAGGRNVRRYLGIRGDGRNAGIHRRDTTGIQSSDLRAAWSWEVSSRSSLCGESKPSPDRICLWSSALFFGYVLVRAWFSPVPYLARVDIFSILGGLVVYLIVALILTPARWRMAMLVALIVVALAQVWIGALQFRGGNNFMLIPFLQRFDYGRRASGFYVCPNHFAGLVEVIGVFCVSLVCWSRWAGWAKLLVGYAGLVCYAGLALTGSRGGYLSASVSLLVIAILSLLALRKTAGGLFWRVAGAGGLFAIMLIAAVLFGFKQSDYLSGRAKDVVDPQNIRLDLWEAAIAQWKLQPAIGTGSGTYLYYGRHFRTPRMQLDPVEVHNDYLHLLAEYGAVGGAAFLFFLGAHFWRGWKTFKKLGPRRIANSGQLSSNNLALTIGALGAMAAYGVHSLFDFNLHIPANVLLLAFVFGILVTPESDRGGDTAAHLSFSGDSSCPRSVWPCLLWPSATWSQKPGQSGRVSLCGMVTSW